MAISDLNRDGRPDLAALNHAGVVSVLLNGEGLSFRFPRAVPFQMPGGSACDVDGDGDVDLLSAGGQLEIFLNVGGDALFESREVIDLPGSLPRLVCGDLDGDGLSDLIAAASADGEGLRNKAVAVLLLRNISIRPDSLDLNRNRVPDECEATAFRRGNAVADGAVDLTDAVHLLEVLFLGAALAGCPDAADADDDGDIGITDPIRLLGSLFLGEGPLPPPARCGIDPTPDRLPACFQGEC